MKAPLEPLDPALVQAWRDAWPQALLAWGRWTRLPEPFFAETMEDVKTHGLQGVLAQFNSESKGIQVNLPELRHRGLEGFPLEILAHEVGHHVLSPSDLLTHFRTLARIRKGLPTFESRCGEVANLWADILVNDRLFRNASLPMDRTYRALAPSKGLVWAFYMRIYERLWDLKKGDLHSGEGAPADPALAETFEADTWLGARTARVYGNDPIRGAGRFAALLLPWIVLEKETAKVRMQSIWMDGRKMAEGSGIPAGLGQADDDEPVLHPSEDPAITGGMEGFGDRKARSMDNASASSKSGGQWREPWEYRELLALGGIPIDETKAAVNYYRERALPHLVSTPRVVLPGRPDPLPEGLDPWDIGDSLENLDMFQSIMQSPRLVPGMTTVTRHWGEERGKETRIRPLDLDLYVDSSGSMPDPRHTTSFLALAGAIVAMSVLRRGGMVQVTLWSGKRQCMRTEGFVRDEDEVLSVLCSHFGGATAFPIHALRSTWCENGNGNGNHVGARKAHILHISDEGLSTLFDEDELGNPGWDICEAALKKAGGGGTMVLQLPAYLSNEKGSPVSILEKARDDQGWDLYKIADWSDLMDFAVRFSQTHSGREKTHR